MENVSVHREIGAPPGDVWRVAGNFSRAGEWCSGIVSLTTDGQGIGAIRRVNVGGAEPIVEQLAALDPVGRRLTYKVLTGPLPVEDYVAEIAVNELGPGLSRVSYSAHYTPATLSADKCQRIFTRAFTQSLDGLELLFASSRS